ncbi:MAG: exo-alpha-sialidase [Bryobacterales bacterium]|nr:exo-alpha-sialidase [Bryobacterales bacterium]
MISRRGFVLGGLALPRMLEGRSDLIAGIRHSVLWEGRKQGKVWFHPRACRIPGKEPVLLMTLQEITGSDVFHHVHWSESRDLAASWSEPKPIPGMGRRKTADGLEEGICDVVPEYHARTKTVLAMGHNVYYDRTGKLARPDTERWPVYIVRDPAGRWGTVRKLEWDNPEASAMYTSNCSQRVTLENGEILVPLSFGPLGRRDRGVCTALCSFDGKELRIRKSGNVQRNAVKRGLLEPSLARFAGRYYMTIRAEDDRGYVTVSPDGLEWEEKRAWCWDDGEPLTMSTTQQRWLPHSEGLYLAYTRKDASNINVVRWRTPIFAAEVDVEKLCLIRSTERVVFRIEGDGVNHPETVPYLGNFHTTAISPRESIVTTCETLPKVLRGNTIQARVRWAKVNRDVA